METVEEFLQNIASRYIESMREPGRCWGGDIELNMIAVLNKAEILIEDEKTPQRYFIGDQASSKKIWLYYDGLHYSLGIMQADGNHERHDIKRDGDCLFNACIQGLKKLENASYVPGQSSNDEIKQIRNAVCDALLNDEKEKASIRERYELLFSPDKDDFHRGKEYLLNAPLLKEAIDIIRKCEPEEQTQEPRYIDNFGSNSNAVAVCNISSNFNNQANRINKYEVITEKFTPFLLNAVKNGKTEIFRLLDLLEIPPELDSHEIESILKNLKKDVARFRFNILQRLLKKKFYEKIKVLITNCINASKVVGHYQINQLKNNINECYAFEQLNDFSKEREVTDYFNQDYFIVEEQPNSKNEADFEKPDDSSLQKEDVKLILKNNYDNNLLELDGYKTTAKNSLKEKYHQDMNNIIKSINDLIPETSNDIDYFEWLEKNSNNDEHIVQLKNYIDGKQNEEENGLNRLERDVRINLLEIVRHNHFKINLVTRVHELLAIFTNKELQNYLPEDFRKAVDVTQIHDLIIAGLSPNISEPETGQTLLHVLMQKYKEEKDDKGKRQELIELSDKLLIYGANPFTKNNEGDSCLALALREKDKSILFSILDSLAKKHADEKRDKQEKSKSDPEIKFLIGVKEHLLIYGLTICDRKDRILWPFNTIGENTNIWEERLVEYERYWDKYSSIETLVNGRKYTLQDFYDFAKNFSYKNNVSVRRGLRGKSELHDKICDLCDLFFYSSTSDYQKNLDAKAPERRESRKIAQLIMENKAIKEELEIIKEEKQVLISERNKFQGERTKLEKDHQSLMEKCAQNETEISRLRRKIEKNEIQFSQASSNVQLFQMFSALPPEAVQVFIRMLQTMSQPGNASNSAGIDSDESSNNNNTEHLASSFKFFTTPR